MTDLGCPLGIVACKLVALRSCKVDKLLWSVSPLSTKDITLAVLTQIRAVLRSLHPPLEVGCTTLTIKVNIACDRDEVALSLVAAVRLSAAARL